MIKNHRLPSIFETLLIKNSNEFLFNFGLGKMTVEEIGEDFTQDDLISDDVMILDGGSNIFVWIGKGSNADERKHAPE